MTDRDLLALYTAHDERAVAETDARYGKLLRQTARRILGSKEDAEEIVNDVLMRAWRCIPEEPPEKLLPYLTVMTRNLATNRLDRYTAKRRQGERSPAVLDELSECLAAPESVDDAVDQRLLAEAVQRFLHTLPEDARAVFLLRYYYVLPLADIAAQRGIGLSRVKVLLMRTRKKLRAYLEQEGFL